MSHDTLIRCVLTEYSSSSIGTAILVGFGLLIYRSAFSAGRFSQSAFASGTSNPQLGGPVIRTFQPPPPGVPHVWNDASEPQQRNVELWARNCREFCWKWRLPRHFWVLLYAVNLRHGTDSFTSPPKEGALRIFSPEKSEGFGRVWTCELGYQRPARLPLDHRSRFWRTTNKQYPLGTTVWKILKKNIPCKLPQPHTLCNVPCSFNFWLVNCVIFNFERYFHLH